MYSMESRIRYSETDCEGKMTITALLNYFQDCCTFQSEDLQVGVDFLREKNTAWMLLSWQITVERYPVLGENIKVITWPYEFGVFYGFRNFVLEDAGGNRIAWANTVWAYVDMKNGRPCKVVQEILDAYQLEPRLEMDYKNRKMEIPAEYEEQEAFVVHQTLIDTNLHVNNERYIEIAKAYLPEQFVIREMRVEYRKSAVLGDTIYPCVSSKGDIVTVVLADGQNKPYAIVEFKEKV